ncbi:MAG: DUF669 domain-containing protein [Burkholderiaceae bacterium]
MGFWQTSSGEKASGEVSDNNFAPLPKGDYTAMFESAEIKVWEGIRSINLKTRILSDFGKNRVLFFTIRAWDEDEKKRDRALNLLVKIHEVLGVPLPEDEPDDVSLSRITDKPIIIKTDVWKIEESGKSGNWLVNVKSVNDTGSDKPATSAPTGRVGGTKPVASTFAGIEDEDIPF